MVFPASSALVPVGLCGHIAASSSVCVNPPTPRLSLTRTLVIGCRAHLENPGCAHLKMLIISAKTPFQLSPCTGSGIGTWTCLGHHPAHSSSGRLMHGRVQGQLCAGGGQPCAAPPGRATSMCCRSGRDLPAACRVVWAVLDDRESTECAENVTFYAFEAHSLIQQTLVPSAVLGAGLPGNIYPARLGNSEPSGIWCVADK